MHKSRLLFLSDVLPQPSGAGQTLLHRHFAQDESYDCFYPRSSPLLSVVQKTLRLFFSKSFPGLDSIILGWLPSFLFTTSKDLKSVDLIVSVAHGYKYAIAARLSIHYRKPLILFHHDLWHNTTASESSFVSRILAQRLHFASTAASINYSISPGMSKYLPPSSTKLLYPVGSLEGSRDNQLSLSKHQTSGTIDKPYTVIYAGNLDAYANMIYNLSLSIKRNTLLYLKIAGYSSHWSKNFLKYHTHEYIGLLSENELRFQYACSSASIVPLSFDPQHRSLVKSSFPSKLTEIISSGLPIVLWAPKYSSAYEVLSSYEAAFFYTDSSASALPEFIVKCLSDKLHVRYVVANAHRMYSELFDFNVLQSRLKSEIGRVIMC